MTREYAEIGDTADKVLVEPRGLAGGRFRVAEDPAGAVAALFQP